jgi:hypothetical protein
MLGVLSDASSSGVVDAAVGDASGDAGGWDGDAGGCDGNEGGWDGGEATCNGDGAHAAVATDAVTTRNGSKRQRLSGKFPSTVLVCCIMCVCVYVCEYCN